MKNHWNATLRRKESALPESAPQVLKAYMMQIGLIDSCKGNHRGSKRKRGSGSKDTANTDDASSDPNWEPSAESLEALPSLSLSAVAVGKAKMLSAESKRITKGDSSFIEHDVLAYCPELHDNSTAPSPADGSSAALPGTCSTASVQLPINVLHAAAAGTSDMMPPACFGGGAFMFGHPSCALDDSQAQLSQLQAARAASSTADDHTTASLSHKTSPPGGLLAAVASSSSMSVESVRYSQTASLLGSPDLPLMNANSGMGATMCSTPGAAACSIPAGVDEYPCNTLMRMDSRNAWTFQAAQVPPAQGVWIDKSGSQSAAPQISGKELNSRSAVQQCSMAGFPDVDSLVPAAAVGGSVAVDAQESAEIENTLMWLQSAGEQVQVCLWVLLVSRSP